MKTPNDFPQAFARMVQFFPTVGAAFFRSLLVRLPADVTDQELTAAIHLKHGQRSEALWLHSIPTLIENMRQSDRARTEANRERAEVYRSELLKLRAEAVAANDTQTIDEIDQFLKDASIQT